jgi:hypothetical protein
MLVTCENLTKLIPDYNLDQNMNRVAIYAKAFV